MAETATGTDMGIGLAMFFGVLALVGAFGMFATYETNVLAGWSFAVAVVAGIVSILAIHLYD
jgi:hypothetical protein